MVSHFGITVCIILALISTLRLSQCYAQDIRLFGGSGSYEGRVEVRVNGQWGTVCNETWDIQDANVVCRELGNRTATMFTTMYGEGQGPILYSNVMCTGDEQRLGDCPHDEGSVDVCQHAQDAGVQCDFKNDDLRLVGGSTPNEGRVEVYRNGQWGRVCADSSWEKEESDVVCRTVGYPTGASMSSTGNLGNGTGSVFLVGLTCTGRETNVLGCMDASFATLSACPHDEADATVVCSLAPEVITEQLSTGAIAGIGIGFGLVIIMCCIFSLNCKCRPFWKKRELDDTDVYQCNTASNADSKNYSTTSNLKSESENRNDSMSDIDPNLFVFAPKIPPAGFGGPSADASGTNGTLPNIEEAKEPNGVAPVSEMQDDNKDESDIADDVRLNLGEDVDVHDDDEKENVTIDMHGGAHFNKDNHELDDNPIHNADVNEDESESVSIDQQAGDQESHDQSHDQPCDELVASTEGADIVSNLVAYDTRL